jgi:arylsulfatase A-like enzyme
MRRILAVFFGVAFILRCGWFVPGVPAETPTAFLTLETQTKTEAYTPPAAASTPSFTMEPTNTPRVSAQHVLIVSIDGLRADALQQADVPNIGALEYDGAVSFTAQTAFPSVTLPAHSSMLSGVCVPTHGITFNDEFNGTYIKVDTVFSIAHQAGLRTIMVVGKDKLKTVARPGTVDEFEYVAASDEEIAGKAVQKMAGGFGVLFVHLPEVDGMGHDSGWNSPNYFSVIHRADTAVGILVDGLKSHGLAQGTIGIITADHGGHGTTHGTTLPEDMTIPWIIMGPGVKPSRLNKLPISTTDTAATAIWSLGLAVPSAWDGRPVVEAFGLTAAQAGVPEATFGRCKKP